MHHQTCTTRLRELRLYSCKIKYTQYLSKKNIKDRKEWYNLYKDWTVDDWKK